MRPAIFPNYLLLPGAALLMAFTGAAITSAQTVAPPPAKTAAKSPASTTVKPTPDKSAAKAQSASGANVKSGAKAGPAIATGSKPGDKPAAAPAPAPAGFVKPNRPLAGVTALAFSDDGKKLAVGTYGQVVVYDTAGWQQLAVNTRIEDSARTLMFHPDNKTLAIGCGQPGRSGTTVLWDSVTGQIGRELPRQFDVVESVAFETSGRGLLIGADDNKVRYFADAASGSGTILDAHNGRVQAVAFSPRENTIFVTGAMDRLVKVWDAKSVRNVVNFDQSEAGITGLTFLSNGVQFVGGSMDGRIYWWGVNYDEKKREYSGYHFRTIGAHTGGVYTLAGSKDHRRFATGGPDHSVCVWDTDSGNQVRAFRDTTSQPIYAVALTADGKIVAGGGREGLIYVWDVEGNKQLTTLAPPALPAATLKTAAGAASSAGRKSK